ncbi:MAG: sugar nucleotide-binding protein [Bacteroidetes bacterium]|nr:sugar nucleotide-binding protein [Bacteroidota bacterium]
MNNKILILGVSGFIGNAIYKELLPYFDVYGTYCTSKLDFDENKVLYKFDVANDTIEDLLDKIQPNYIISSLRGDYTSQISVHEQLVKYALKNEHCRILYLSTVNVFDAKFKFPSYENDLVLADSDYGRFKISVEKIIATLPVSKFAILRLPLVIGVNSPRIVQLKQSSKHQADFEVYPNLIISITTANKIAQQIHYIINKNKFGIFHLASNDVIHHNDLFEELSKKLSLNTIIFKQVFTTNEDAYLAILPKDNKLPRNYRTTVSKVIDECTLKEEIGSLINKKVI